MQKETHCIVPYSAICVEKYFSGAATSPEAHLAEQVLPKMTNLYTNMKAEKGKMNPLYCNLHI